MASFKDWFINSDESQEQKPVETKKTSDIKFPSSENSESKSEGFKFPETTTNINSSVSQVSYSETVTVKSPQEYAEKALEIYEKCFDGLNQDGFDFYEYYKSIMSGGGVNNPQMYAMAFQMAVGLDKSITKEKLVQQAEYYMSEIKKAYDSYSEQGKNKHQEILNVKNQENTSLVNELDMFKQQLETLKVQIEDREKKLAAIDSKFEPMLKDVENKISANDLASNQVINSIQTVKNGIITNIK